MELQVQTRKELGKGPSRRYRKEGNVIGIVYGSNKEPIPVFTSAETLETFIKANGTSKMFSLNVEGTSKLVLFKKIEREIMSRRISHIDFQEVDQNKEVERELQLNFVGTPIGVAQEGGVAMVLNRNLTISCLPKDIPEKAFDVDTEHLNLNDTLHASDITLPANITLVSSSDTPLVSISMPKEEVVAAPAEGEAAEGEAAAEGETPAEATPAEGEEKKEPELVDQKGKKEE